MAAITKALRSVSGGWTGSCSVDCRNISSAGSLMVTWSFLYATISWFVGGSRVSEFFGGWLVG